MTHAHEATHSRREITRAHRMAKIREVGYPRAAPLRWLVRLGFSLPYVAVALVVNLTSSTIAATPNATLIERTGQIDWTRLDVEWLQQAYPPITTALAAVIPGGRLGLSLVGAIVAGFLLHRLLEIMVQRGYPPGTIVFLLLAFGANPLYAYTSTENLEGIVSLALFGVGLADTVRFFTWNDTRAGFRAGLLYMLAIFSSPAAFFYVVVAILAAPFLRLARKGQGGARGANLLILAYPAIASLLAFAFLEWAFLGRPFGFVLMLTGSGRPFDEIMTILFTTFNGFLIIAPVLSAWLVSLIVRRPAAIVVSTLVFCAVVANAVLGFLPTNAAGDTFLLMVLMAMVMIPLGKSIVTVLMVDVVAVLQIVIGWTAAYNREIVLSWIAAIVSAANG